MVHSMFLGVQNITYALAVLAPLTVAVKSVRTKYFDIPAVGLTKMIAQSSAVAIAFSLISKAFSIPKNPALYIGYATGCVVFCHLVKNYNQELTDERKQDEYITSYPWLNKVIRSFNDIYFGKN